MTPLEMVPRTKAQQATLPLTAVPDRPFLALARDARVGGLVRKLVYLVLASYCPTQAKEWRAKGRVCRGNHHPPGSAPDSWPEPDPPGAVPALLPATSPAAR